MFWVASDGKQRIAGGGIAGAQAHVTPVGELHGVDPETEQVLCGLPLDSLYQFRDVGWEKLRVPGKCQRCERALAAR